MDTAKTIRESFQKLYEKLKSAQEISEEDLRVAFVRSGILEALGYEGEPKDVRFEQRVRGKRSDLLAFDEYQNVIFVIWNVRNFLRWLKDELAYSLPS